MDGAPQARNYSQKRKKEEVLLRACPSRRQNASVTSYHSVSKYKHPLDSILIYKSSLNLRTYLVAVQRLGIIKH